MNKSTKLSVNINKIALIRNSRKTSGPNLLKMAIDLESFGADGITIHPRPDQRHIRYDDIEMLKSNIKTELNIEGFPSDKFINIVTQSKPAQVTLVPDPPNALTSDQGWNFLKYKNLLSDSIAEFKKHQIRVSLFIDANESNVIAAKELNAERIELYTGPYAFEYHKNKEEAIQPHIRSSILANKLGLGVNAGHDLNIQNLKYYSINMPFLDEVSIGHALICDALYFGYSNAINIYKQLM